MFEANDKSHPTATLKENVMLGEYRKKGSHILYIFSVSIMCYGRD
jgi:hypothetical protein